MVWTDVLSSRQVHAVAVRPSVWFPPSAQHHDGNGIRCVWTVDAAAPWMFGYRLSAHDWRTEFDCGQFGCYSIGRCSVTPSVNIIKRILFVKITCSVFSVNAFVYLPDRCFSNTAELCYLKKYWRKKYEEIHYYQANAKHKIVIIHYYKLHQDMSVPCIIAPLAHRWEFLQKLSKLRKYGWSTDRKSTVLFHYIWDVLQITPTIA